MHRTVPSKLLMVGDGPDKRTAELLAQKLGIKEDVIFLGNSSEVAEFYVILMCFYCLLKRRVLVWQL